MNEDDFLETVRRDAPLESDDSARAVTEATLQTLGERIADGEATELADQLPDAFAVALTDVDPGEAEPFSLETFIGRVSDRADIDEAEVIAQSRAVAGAVATTAESELETAREQLPSEFDVIFEPGGPITEDAFLETVRERAGLESRDAARDATTATLRTLGERLSGGETGDLPLYLPNSLARALLESDESIRGYSFEEFIERIARREDVDESTATTHAKAVCSTLAETASERELSAAKKQLPDPFGRVFDRPNERSEER